MKRLCNVPLTALILCLAGRGLAQPAEVVHSAPTVRAPDRPEAREARATPLGPQFGIGFTRTVTLEPFSTDLLDELKRQDTEPGQKRLRVGLVRPLDKPIVVDRTNVPASEWTILPDGSHLWSVQISSPGALAIRLHLESLALPEQARLLLYDPANSSQAVSPLTAAKLSGQREIWMHTILGQTAVLECQLPVGVEPATVSFSITGLSHTYRSLATVVQPRAEPCENDVSCYSSWANQAAAVARIQFVDTGAEYLCTGCLINHTDTTNTADFFLTANHCIGDQTVASTIQFFWFYQTSNCDGAAPDMNNVPSTSGATLLATSAVPPGNDFSLLQLPQAPPSGVFYAGWTTALPTNNESVAIIHHPGLPPGDYTRISFGHEVGTGNLDALTGGGGPQDNVNNAWQVQWFSGVTEDGSSGSPLFDANQQIIGQLYGGTSDCTNQTGTDLFGRFDVTYNNIHQYIDPGSVTNTNTNTGLVTVITNGVGTVSPNYNNQILQPNRTYTVTARPGANYVFAGWTGTFASSAPTLSFTVSGPTVLQANFVPNPFLPVAGTYYGMFSDTNGAQPQSSGFLTLAVSSRGGYTGRLQAGSSAYSLTGSFASNGSVGPTNVGRGANALNITMTLDLSGATDHLTGTVTGSAFTAQLAADRAVFNARTNPAPYQGKYTLIIPGVPNAPTLPQGNGFGTVTVSSTGKLTLSGALADGTVLNQSTGISKTGLWPLYVPLYRGLGLVQGWLGFNTNPPSSGVQGTVAWARPSQASSKLYAAGFTNESLLASGSLFSAAVPVINLVTGAVLFAGGDLSAPFTNVVTLGSNSQAKDDSTNRITLTFARSTGLFSGMVTVPGTTHSVPFHGAVLQNAAAGYGYFLGTNQSGSVTLGPSQ
ncbi:putative Lysyl endopeptidase [Verrucomicrobia bacterium]|nr:putative Lysyl endopeptidase [Verrucomicrobiota bacterium]